MAYDTKDAVLSVRRAVSPATSPLFGTAILMVAYAFAFLDRQILSLLVEPIKHDLHLNDSQLSLLLGLAFVALLAVVGLPIGRLVDTRRRTTIIAIGIAVWSLMTASCGLAQNYLQLLLGRMGVGVGEACLTPSAYSMLADYFPAKRHGLAFGIYGIGVYVGLGLSFVIGGEVIGRLGTGPLALPWGGAMATWRLAFIAVGLPGLLVAVLVARLAEPKRRGSALSPNLSDVYAYLRAWWLPILLTDLCLALAAMAGYSLTAWIPSFFIRTYGWTAPEIGQRFGLVIVLSGILGYVAGGWAGDALIARGIKAGRLLLVMAATLAAIPFAIAAPLAGDGWRALALYGATLTLVTTGTGLIPAVQLGIVPAGMRGLAISLGTLVVNSLGLGLGPTAVALITDYVIRDEAKIRYGLALAPSAMLLACVLCGLACMAPYVRCARRLDAA
jgi:MFS family permease